MHTSSSWLKFFCNSTLRFSILRAICIFAMLLLCNVPTHVLRANISCRTIRREFQLDDIAKHERMHMIYSYLLYSFTFLHHFARWFPSISSLTGIRGLTAIQCIWSEFEPTWHRRLFFHRRRNNSWVHFEMRDLNHLHTDAHGLLN